MVDDGENLVIRLLREIRDRLDKVEDKIDDLSVKTDGHTAILIGLGKYIHDIDERVGHLEKKLGVDG
jgi:archaellum component FlaC